MPLEKKLDLFLINYFFDLGVGLVKRNDFAQEVGISRQTTLICILDTPFFDDLYS